MKLQDGSVSLVERWISALEGGTYKQAVGRLRRDDGFCCLGVLCDLYDPSGWKYTGPGAYGYSYRDGCIVGLPDEIRDSVGLNYANAKYLAEMNDSRKSFKEIADKIKEMLNVPVCMDGRVDQNG